MFRIPILDFVAHDHPLILLAEKVDWNSLKQHFDDLYKTGVGQPPLEVRLVLGLHMLKLDCCVRIFNQKHSDKNKIYSYHAQEVRCIAKGKAHKKYEFGNKVSISSTAKSGWIVGIKSFDENIYDGKTAKDSIEQVTRISGSRPSEALVERGYRGYQGDTNDQGQKRGISKTMRAWLRRRSRIEPIISRMAHPERFERPAF